MDPIKEAFSKVKEDMDTLKEAIILLQQQVADLKNSFETQKKSKNTPTDALETPTLQHIIPTHKLNELDNMPLYSLKSPNTSFSTGNEGVPTNQPTNQQTNQHIQHTGKSDQISRLERAAEILNSLDELKKEVRIKFKRLTDQEMVVFSAIYTLEETGQLPDYTSLATHLNLTEISIRDYVRKIINKGIPVDKIKENNKKITLSISPDFKRVASLQTIMQLREL